MSEDLTEPFTRPVPQHGVVNGRSFPAPPKLHWALVVLFTILTVGFFLIAWTFIQSSWARKIDPRSNATAMFIAYLLIFVFSQMLEASGPNLKSIGVMFLLASYAVFYVGTYSIRRSMLNHYNSVEPMPLKLSAALTFLLSTLYLQYHMTRIAKWKASGGGL